MYKNVTINSNDLFKISHQLLNQYDIESTIYHLLLLSFLTVREFSRKIHLDAQARINLSVQYMPDLIVGLKEIDVVVPDFNLTIEDMTTLITVFQQIKSETIVKKKSCCYK